MLGEKYQTYIRGSATYLLYGNFGFTLWCQLANPNFKLPTLGKLLDFY